MRPRIASLSVVELDDEPCADERDLPVDAWAYSLVEVIRPPSSKSPRACAAISSCPVDTDRSGVHHHAVWNVERDQCVDVACIHCLGERSVDVFGPLHPHGSRVEGQSRTLGWEVSGS